MAAAAGLAQYAEVDIPRRVAAVAIRRQLPWRNDIGLTVASIALRRHMGPSQRVSRLLIVIEAPRFPARCIVTLLAFRS